MPEPGSHKFDVKRTRLRGEYERDRVPNVPDKHADDAARADLERDNPPHRLPPEQRAAGPHGATQPPGTERGGGGLELRSPTFTDHGFLPEKHAHLGDNVAPRLEWSDVPDGTAELVLLCEDLDAPSGLFPHWVVTGIPPDARSLGPELPSGARAGRNGFGEEGWGGPQPPVGDDPHRYRFQLTALDDRLDVSPDADADEVRAAAAEHAVANGTLVGLFGR